VHIAAAGLPIRAPLIPASRHQDRAGEEVAGALLGLVGLAAVVGVRRRQIAVRRRRRMRQQALRQARLRARP
jgi:MYXO-CTERM domain-containing protein